MKYLKLYEEFVSKETKVNWGEAELEIKEMFRIFKELKQLPSELIVDGEKFTIDKSIFNLDEPKEFETQGEICSKVIYVFMNMYINM